MTQHDSTTESTQAVDDAGASAPRPTRPASVVPELARGLSATASGVGFIGAALDRVVDYFDLHSAVAVVEDPVFGLQLFTAGRRPFEIATQPSTFLRRGRGIHTNPTVPNAMNDLDAVAGLCEVALRLDRLRHESLHDALTGLANRRGFDDQLAQAVSRSLRYGWTFALVLVDLDGFKAINDRVGHQGGDAVLRDVGERLRHGLRAGDIAARVGGDEFALLLHVDETTTVANVLERLHGPVGLVDTGDHPIHWTVGAAMCPNDAASVDELYRLADDRLYEAKAARRPEA
jgi:diguanylate cyclase (GGDEF)-like protein